MRLQRTWILCALLVGCGLEPQPSSVPVPSGDEPDSPGPGIEALASFPTDFDLDGHFTPDDCLDTGVAWRVQEPDCVESLILEFDPSDGQHPKDFTIVNQNGTYHIIHIRRLGPWGTGTNETDFGHETTTDLVNFTYHPPIQLLGAPDTWNDRNIWAPHVIEKFGTYYMYFTGVTYDADRGFNAQRIGMASSTDLFNWTLDSSTCAGVAGPGCLLDCDALWSGWDPNGEWTGDCRDPWVMPYLGGYVMFLTTILPNQKQVIARAQSPDLTSWSLVDYIDFTEAARAESPAVIERNGTFYLFWTNHAGVYYATASDPMGTWTNKGYTHFEYASELLPFPDDSFLYGFVDGNRLKFERLTWKYNTFLEFSNIASPVCQIPARFVYPSEVDPINGVDDNCDGYPDVVYDPPPPGPERPTKLRFTEVERGRF